MRSGTGRGMKPEGATGKGITLYRTAIGGAGLNTTGGCNFVPWYSFDIYGCFAVYYGLAFGKNGQLGGTKCIGKRSLRRLFRLMADRG